MDAMEMGREALPFELATDEAPVRLAELRGKFVVLFFYPKDDTSACTAEAVDFSALAPEFAAAGAVVIGISPDLPKKHARFRHKHGLTIVLASDAERRLIEGYGLWVEKSLYGRRYMGVERTTLLIDRDGRIARVWRKVKVKDHAAEVLAAVRELAETAK